MLGDTMWGADVDALDNLARDLATASETLQATGVRLQRSVHAAPWRGLGADRFRLDWVAWHGRSVTEAASALQQAATLVARQAVDQRRASDDLGHSAGGGWPGVGLGLGWHPLGPEAPRPVTVDERRRLESRRSRIDRALDTGGLGVTRGDLAVIRDQFEGLSGKDREALMLLLTDEQRAVLRDQMQESWIKGGWSHQEQARFVAMFAGQPDALRALLGSDYPAQTEQSRVHFTSPAQTAAWGMTEDLRTESKDQITLVRLDNGNWVVHLPGVVDLPDGLADSRAWAKPNAWDSPRDMRWATDSSLRGSVAGGSWDNPYAASVRIAMQEAGVPAGAKVLLTGHSFGGYTAMELAADGTFNDPASGGFDVVSVISMGADTDWRMDDMPAGTSGLVLNNLFDFAFEVESQLGRDPASVPPNWHEEVFLGGGDHWGHGLSNYQAWLAGHGDELQPELDEFTGSGTSYQYAVKDIYR